MDDTQRAPKSLRHMRPARRRSLPQEVGDQLLDLVASAGVSQVTLPSERELGQQFGVSRNVIREALSALDEVGVVSTHGKRRVADRARASAQLVARTMEGTPQRRLLLDPLEVRRMLEVEAAGVAAERIDAAGLEELERWFGLMRDAAGRGDPGVDHDSAFHLSIARATGNHTLVQILSALTDTLRTSRERSFEPSAAASTAIADHEAILEALRDRDPAAARAAMRSHLDRVEGLIRSTFLPGDDGPPDA
ncbi:MAG: GntR family transcriptional regulator, transcriptional repressor for pyruvate dehydrogenase complex [Solirubrobacteraceae bacterium]|nr:GntR family transcriptional regulator, transcriptional repressor for pyruvate dehydrogenase complex [Solirubrobacteraceae bacterium]